ncbi:MAG: TrkH family potassium uptake protein [Methanocellales archaeon]
MDLKIILRDLGGLMAILGIVMDFAMLPALYFREYEGILDFFILSLICIILGLALRFGIKADEPELKHAIIIAAIGWLLIAFISAIPFMIIEHSSFIDGFFEAMSGWTGTGLTIFAKPSALSHTIQFWRSTMQWVGGIGVIVLMVSILARPGTGAFALYKAEGREARIHPSIISTVRTIWWIYLGITIFGIALFSAAGMPLWDAINHAMVTLGTGGFSIKDGSIGEYNNIYIEIISLIIMFLGCVPFLLYYNFLKGNFKAFIRDIQIKAFLSMILIGVVTLVFENFYFARLELFDSIRYSSFQFISGLSTCGLQNSDISNWSPTALIILSIAMILGAPTGSTGGGIKTVRVLLFFAGIEWWFKRTLMPKHGIAVIRFGGKRLTEDKITREISEAMLIIFLWIVFLGFSIISLLHLMPQFPVEKILFEVSSAQSNVGLSSGLTSANMPVPAKVLLIFNMWIGRLEIIPVLLLFRALIRGFRIE